MGDSMMLPPVRRSHLDHGKPNFALPPSTSNMEKFERLSVALDAQRVRFLALAAGGLEEVLFNAKERSMVFLRQSDSTSFQITFAQSDPTHNIVQLLQRFISSKQQRQPILSSSAFSTRGVPTIANGTSPALDVDPTLAPLCAVPTIAQAVVADTSDSTDKEAELKHSLLQSEGTVGQGMEEHPEQLHQVQGMPDREDSIEKRADGIVREAAEAHEGEAETRMSETRVEANVEAQHTASEGLNTAMQTESEEGGKRSARDEEEEDEHEGGRKRARRSEEDGSAEKRVGDEESPTRAQQSGEKTDTETEVSRETEEGGKMEANTEKDVGEGRAMEEDKVAETKSEEEERKRHQDQQNEGVGEKEKEHDRGEGKEEAEKDPEDMEIEQEQVVDEEEQRRRREQQEAEIARLLQLERWRLAAKESLASAASKGDLPRVRSPTAPESHDLPTPPHIPSEHAADGLDEGDVSQRSNEKADSEILVRKGVGGEVAGSDPTSAVPVERLLAVEQEIPARPPLETEVQRATLHERETHEGGAENMQRSNKVSIDRVPVLARLSYPAGAKEATGTVVKTEPGSCHEKATEGNEKLVGIGAIARTKSSDDNTKNEKSSLPLKQQQQKQQPHTSAARGQSRPSVSSSATPGEAKREVPNADTEAHNSSPQRHTATAATGSARTSSVGSGGSFGTAQGGVRSRLISTTSSRSRTVATQQSGEPSHSAYSNDRGNYTSSSNTATPAERSGRERSKEYGDREQRVGRVREREWESATGSAHSKSRDLSIDRRLSQPPATRSESNSAHYSSAGSSVSRQYSHQQQQGHHEESLQSHYQRSSRLETQHSHHHHQPHEEQQQQQSQHRRGGEGVYGFAYGSERGGEDVDLRSRLEYSTAGGVESAERDYRAGGGVRRAEEEWGWHAPARDSLDPRDVYATHERDEDRVERERATLAGARARGGDTHTAALLSPHPYELSDSTGPAHLTHTERAERERKRVRGEGWLMSVPHSYYANLEKCLRDDCDLMALYDGYFCVYDSGHVAFFSVPPVLDSTMRQRPDWYPATEIIALGNRDRYFIQFADNLRQWSATCSHYFADCVRDLTNIRRVAFGATDEAWVVQHGTELTCGVDTPDDLVALFQELKPVDIEIINMGPDGQWFVRNSRGRYWIGYGNMSRLARASVMEALRDLDKTKKRDNNNKTFVREVVFGSGDSWVLRHTKTDVRA